MGSEVVGITMTVNGEKVRSHVEPRLLLAHFLRNTLELTGTHVGCDTSQCGACTVLIDGRAVKSCTVLAVQVDGCAVATVEGLQEDGALHPVQQGFRDKHGLQCGFCTPGVMMTAAAMITDNTSPTDAEIRNGLDGVICRCTGYETIVRAVQEAARLQRAQQNKSATIAADAG